MLITDNSNQPVNFKVNKSFAISPNDEIDLPFITDSIYIASGGNIRMLLENDETAITLVEVPSSTVLNLRIKKIFSTGTEAASLVGFYFSSP